MSELIWFEGEWTDTDVLPASALKRAWAFGELIFETLRSDSGNIPFLLQHVQRMERALDLMQSATKNEALVGLIQTCAQEAHERLNSPHLALRVNAYRSGQTLFDAADSWSFFILPRAIESASVAAAAPLQMDFQVLPQGMIPGRAGLKTSNYLPYLMGQGHDSGVERILCTAQGQLLDGLRSQPMFQMQDGSFWLPQPDLGCLESISRQRCLSWLQGRRAEVRTEAMFLEQLPQVRHAWLANAVWGLRPVSKMADRALMVSTFIPVEEFWKGSF